MAVPQVTGLAGCFVDDECEGMAVLEAGLKPRQPGLHRERSFLLHQQAPLHDAINAPRFRERVSGQFGRLAESRRSDDPGIRRHSPPGDRRCPPTCGPPRDVTERNREAEHVRVLNAELERTPAEADLATGAA